MHGITDKSAQVKINIFSQELQRISIIGLVEQSFALSFEAVEVVLLQQSISLWKLQYKKRSLHFMRQEKNRTQDVPMNQTPMTSLFWSLGETSYQLHGILNMKTNMLMITYIIFDINVKNNTVHVQWKIQTLAKLPILI